MSQAIDEIFHLFLTRGARQYGDEAVSQLAHALQTATWAERSEAPPPLVAAALLHDIGHLLDGGDEELARQGIDARHEGIGHGYLAAHFIDAVSEPVRMHVDAKRYLCAVEPDYHATLSPASRHSLRLQGGVFDSRKAEAFAALPFAQASAALRKWDDLAKDPRAETPGLDHFRPHLKACLHGV